MTNINSRSGNGDYTIAEPELYPFTFSDNPALQYINNQLIKAKPELHKKAFLKPFHRSEGFCSTWVGLPQEVTHYKEFLRQNPQRFVPAERRVRAWRARFYYPPVAKTRCGGCLWASRRAATSARDFDGSSDARSTATSFSRPTRASPCSSIIPTPTA